ncbi:MAG: LIC_13387 family protein [Candidatus Acidiferrales bacterium]
MRSIHFGLQGFNRSYWDFYQGSRFSVGIFFLLSAVLAWQLGSLPRGTLALMRSTGWALRAVLRSHHGREL